MCAKGVITTEYAPGVAIDCPKPLPGGPVSLCAVSGLGGVVLVAVCVWVAPAKA